MEEKDYLGLSLTLLPPSSSPSPQPSSSSCNHRPPQWRHLLLPHAGIDVNQTPPSARNSEASAPLSPREISSSSAKRTSGAVSDEDEDGDGDGDGGRKKLRLSKEQSAVLEESFKEHSTLNPVSSRIDLKAEARAGQAAASTAAAGGSVVPKPAREDQVEADGGGLRAPPPVLPRPDGGEPAAAERSPGTASSEAVAAVLHAHDAPDHPHPLPFLRANLFRRHTDFLVQEPPSAAGGGAAPVPPPPPAVWRRSSVAADSAPSLVPGRSSAALLMTARRACMLSILLVSVEMCDERIRMSRVELVW
ncbi:hypothetical protein Cni_G08966 [Canna indica]|uniref:Uncharacterized protein n=1 Tax=Canna indica TaxID=4628 RepID=A0AAQ3Q8W7_9LILI|nr:hypothetical protein Cni_G08966 [Canna indica]